MCKYKTKNKKLYVGGNMKKTIIIITLSFIAVYSFTQAPDWEWVTQAGGSNQDRGESITTDDDGNSYIAGCFHETATFGSYTLISNGDYDIFAAKMDYEGNWQWASKAGGIDSDEGHGITIDNIGNTYVTGWFNDTATFGSHILISNGGSNIFVAKLDTNGNWLWAIQSDGSSNYGVGITIDTTGNTYITGVFEYTAIFGSYSLTSNGGSDIFVAKVDTNGDWQWVNNGGGSSYDRGEEITIDEFGNTYVTGWFNDTATFGSNSITTSGERDIFVAKMDANGNWLWANKAGGIDHDVGNGISIDEESNCSITGRFEDTATFDSYSLSSNGAIDVFVAKISSEGNWLWAIEAGGYNTDMGYSITVDKYYNCYVTGRFWGTAFFGTDTLATIESLYEIFLAKTDADGNWNWALQAGGSGSDRGNGITLDNSGNIYITGDFYDTATFGLYTLDGYGTYDIFAAKLNNEFISDFVADPIFGYYPSLEVSFNDESYGNITNWFWDFQNDGIYDSYEQNPTYTYTQPGIYDVKLKISNETQVDSLIKYDYITVELVPPSPPTNMQIEISATDALLNWAEVDTTIFGTPINPDYYLISGSYDPYQDFVYIGSTADTTYTHERVGLFNDKMFYRVRSFVGTRQELEIYLEARLDAQ